MSVRRRGGTVEKDRVGDAERFLTAEGLDRDVQGDAQARCDGTHACNRETRANPRSAAHRGEKSHAVEPVIDRRAGSADAATAMPEHREQREHEISVRDRAAVRPLGSAARIGVNPLSVPGACRKGVDPSLVDAQPRRGEQLAAFERAEAGETLHDFRCHLPISLRRRSPDASLDYRTVPD